MDVRSSVQGPTMLEEAMRLSKCRILPLLIKIGDIQMGWFELCEPPWYRELLQEELAARLCSDSARMRLERVQAALKSNAKMRGSTSHW